MPLRAARLALLAGALLVAGAHAAATAPAVHELYGNAFRQSLWIEARAGAGGKSVDAALAQALAAMQEVETATDRSKGPLATLDAAAGGEAQKVPPALMQPLVRALAFCKWSDGMHGPLGALLWDAWGLRAPRPGLPAPDVVEGATTAARCDNLTLDEAKGTAKLAAGAQLDLWAFAPGAAVDRAIERLRAGGVQDASVTLGGIQRAIGSAGDGAGWPLRVTIPAELAEMTGKMRLHDQAIALATPQDAPMRAGGEQHSPYVDQRSGRPQEGVVATLAVTDLAIDAQGVAGTAFAAGNRRGSMLLGQLDPLPAVLWSLGDGSGQSLVTDFHWNARLRRGGG